jgi:hypothetical protein
MLIIFMDIAILATIEEKAIKFFEYSNQQTSIPRKEKLKA